MLLAVTGRALVERLVGLELVDCGETVLLEGGSRLGKIASWPVFAATDCAVTRTLSLTWYRPLTRVRPVVQPACDWRYRADHGRRTEP